MTSAGQTRIYFAGGGTGGHLYPGLAIARAVVRLAPQVAPYFIGARRGIEREILGDTEFAHMLLDLHPFYRRTPWNNWRTMVGAVSAWRAISAASRTAAPQAVLGTGGYAAGVALAWGRAHRVPTFLHEPDSHPGLTTRAFARGARAIYLGFPEAHQRLTPGVHTEVLALGCPIDPPPPADRRPSRLDARSRWGFPDDAFVVLVMGGSQGARAVNEVVAAWIDGGLPDGVCLIWSTGRQQASAWTDRESVRVKVRPYLAPIAEAYAAADVAVARAGAMSIAELSAWGIPALLVPLPTAAQDHQTYNARAAAQSGGAVVLPQGELTAQRLDDEIRSLTVDTVRCGAMRAAMLERARPDAAHAIARSLLDMLAIPARDLTDSPYLQV